MMDYNNHTMNYTYTAGGELARRTYIAFTSPGAEARPLQRGIFHGTRQGSVAQGHCPKGNPSLGQGVFYCRVLVEGPPLKGVARSDGGCMLTDPPPQHQGTSHPGTVQGQTTN